MASVHPIDRIEFREEIDKIEFKDQNESKEFMDTKLNPELKDSTLNTEKRDPNAYNEKRAQIENAEYELNMLKILDLLEYDKCDVFFSGFVSICVGRVAIRIFPKSCRLIIIICI